MPEYLRAFTDDEMLEATVAVTKLTRTLQGRKVEEDDWTNLYCEIKNAPNMPWSNMPFRDYIHDGVGVEFKLLKRSSPSASIDNWLMHPAATRKIDFDETIPPDEAMEKVFCDWNTLINEFEERVRATSRDGRADIRWGVLLWAEDHSEFLYFEERLEKPKVENFYARWHDGQHRGQSTRNLHIFDRATGDKRFSCTLPRNGSKLQPYFRIPSIEEGAHLFRPEKNHTVPIFIGKPDLDRMLTLFPNSSTEDLFSHLLDCEEQRRS